MGASHRQSNPHAASTSMVMVPVAEDNALTFDRR